MEVRQSGEIVVVKPARPGSAHKLHSFVGVKVMLAEVLAEEQLQRMAGSSCPQPCRCRGKCRHIQNRKSRPGLRLRKYFVLEARAGIAQPGHSRVPLNRIVEKPQLEVLYRPPLQQPVDVLVSIRCLKSIFNLEYAPLHHFRG